VLERIITWSLGNRIAVLVGAAIWILAGVLALRGLNVDAFPDTTPVQVQVNAYAASLVPEEIERQITFPIELAMSGMPGLEEIRSISMFGLSQVLVTFRDGTDIYFARQMINERLSSVKMPEGVEQPQMGPVSTGLGEVFHYFLIGRGANGEETDLTQLRTIHDWEVKPHLRIVPGTAEVNSWGGLEKQYQVRIDPTLLFKHDLTFEQVVGAVKSNNVNVGGGNLDRSGDMLLVHGLGRTINTEQVKNIVITAKSGVPIRIRDVADVTIGHEIRKGAVTATFRDPKDPENIVQGEVVLGLGFMLMGENSYEVTRRLREKFNSVQANLPPGVSVMTAYDRTQLVDRVIDTVRNNLLEGATLVVLILFVFLGNLRAGLICATAIPLAMLCGFCGMWWAGIAGSLLSLGAIDFGVVVDSSVVVVENVVKRLGHAGMVSASERMRIIRDAAIEVRTPTVFGQLIIMIVYIPILTLEGVEGKMFRPMAWTVVFVLIGSLIASLTVTPVLASLFLPKQIEEEDVFLVRLAKRLYRPLLDFLLRIRMFAVGTAAVALGVALVVALSLGSEFVPRLSEGAVVIGILRPPGTGLDESLRINQKMEEILLREFPDEVAIAWSRVGPPEVPTDASTVEATDLFISLHSREQWKKARTQSDLISLMEKELLDIPGQTIWFTQPIEQRINEMISGVRADVAIKLFGDDFDELVTQSRRLEKTIRAIPGCADLSTEQMLGQPILQVAIDQEAIARYGIPAQNVLDLVESLGGKVLGDVIEGRLRFPMVVRLPDSMRSTPEAIADIMLAAPSGERIPLSRLADVRIADGPRLIAREWSQRRITIQCNVRGRDIGSFVNDAQKQIAAGVALPAGYRLEWGGQFQNMQRAQRRLTIVVPAALLLIIGLLYLSFRDRFDTLVIFASVPFACIGGILAVWMRGMPLSISAAVGFITLSGISVLSSMVLVTAFRELQHHGKSLADSIRPASMESLRTIVMTALVASVGFVPMAISEGAGAEVQRPLATVVIGGVFTSTIFSLLLLPVLYTWRKPAEISLTPADDHEADTLTTTTAGVDEQLVGV
jgi:cobalt-zinc-cadmium resistance protein CzcA